MTKSKTTLGLTCLEAREVPAVLASFNPATGALSVQIDGNPQTDQYVRLSAVNGVAWLNGKAVIGTNGKAAPSAAVRSIGVTGSNFDNLIDLGAVTTQFFQGLDGRVTITGGKGNDKIYGSGAFGDVIRGGEGNDSLYGYGGDDKLYGEAGRDYLDGALGNDLLDGGADDDVLYGAAGRDTFIGGAGIDFVSYFNPREDTINGVEKY